MIFDFASLERRISTLEAAQSASLRFGRVTSVSGGKARVQFGDGQGMNSFELSTIQKRVLKDQDIKMPDINEPVACLFAGNGSEQGVILGAYYNGENSDPGQDQAIDYHKYEDGTELYYDRVNHKLYAKINGDCELICEKTLKASSQQEAEIHSQKEIKLKAPQIIIEGVLTMENYEGGPTSGTLKGDFHVVEGDIKAESVSLRTHQHENSGGDGIGGKPQGG